MADARHPCMGDPGWNASIARFNRRRYGSIEVVAGLTHLVVPAGYDYVAQDRYGTWWAHQDRPHTWHGQDSWSPGLGGAVSIRRTSPSKHWQRACYRVPRRANAAHRLIRRMREACAERCPHSGRWTVWSSCIGHALRIQRVALGTGTTERAAWINATQPQTEDPTHDIAF